MSDHALLSPSSSKRWMACPGSVKLCEGKKSPDSVYSREGTFLHVVAAQCLTEERNAASLIGMTDGEFTLDLQLAELVQQYLDYVTGRVLLDEALLAVEQRVELPPVYAPTAIFPEERGCWGTADCILRYADVLEVVDLKMGAGELVEAEGNSQLAVYAYGAMEQMQWPEAVRRIRTTITQPRRNGVSTAEMTREEFREFCDRIDEARLAAHRSTELVAGDHCRWCPASGSCPALHAQGLAAARDAFAEDLTPKPLPAVTDLVTSDLQRIHEAASRITAWLERCADELHNRIARGEHVPGWKLVETLSNRKWRSETEAVAALRGAGIDPYEPHVLSPNQAEKRLGPRTKGLVDQLTVRESNGVKLVPESDKRPPAVLPAAAFSVLSD